MAAQTAAVPVGALRGMQTHCPLSTPRLEVAIQIWMVDSTGECSRADCSGCSNSLSGGPRPLQEERLNQKHYISFLGRDCNPDVPVWMDPAQAAWDHHEASPNKPSDRTLTILSEHFHHLRKWLLWREEGKVEKSEIYLGWEGSLKEGRKGGTKGIKTNSS